MTSYDRPEKGKGAWERFKGKAKKAVAIGMIVGASLGVYEGVSNHDKQWKFEYLNEVTPSVHEVLEEHVYEREEVYDESTEVSEVEQYEKEYTIIDSFVGEDNTDQKNRLEEQIEGVYGAVKNNTGVQKSIKGVIRDYGIIEDVSENEAEEKALVGVRMIESSGRINAVSHTGNAGPYQFGEWIGKEYGLEIKDDVDERYDIRKSTEAAAEYLRDMKERYGRWDLAVLSYHQGESNVNRIVSDYLEENKGVSISNGQVRSDVLEDYDVSVSDISDDEEVLSRHMNLEYALTGRNYFQKVLAGVKVFENFIQENDSVRVTNLDTYSVESGDTMLGIVNKFNSDIDETKYFNSNITEHSTIYPGMDILVPNGEREVCLRNLGEKFGI